MIRGRMILRTVGLDKDFGSSGAVNDVNLEIEDAQMKAIIGLLASLQHSA